MCACVRACVRACACACLVLQSKGIITGLYLLLVLLLGGDVELNPGPSATWQDFNPLPLQPTDKKVFNCYKLFSIWHIQYQLLINAG